MSQLTPQKQFDQSKIPKKQSRSEGSAIRRFRAVQELFSRRKKVRKRQRECRKVMRSSIDINLSVNEGQKAAVKELLHKRKAMKRVSLRKGKEMGSVTDQSIGLSRLLRGKKSANESRDGDGSAPKTRKVGLGLLFLGLNWKQGVIIIVLIGWKSLIGSLPSASELRWRKSDLRRKRGRRMERGEVYGFCSGHECAKWSAALVKETNFSLWQVFSSSCAYLNSFVEGTTAEVFSSPSNYFKDENKEEGEVFEEMEAYLEKDDAFEAQVDVQSHDLFMKELERDLMVSSPLEMALNMKETTPSVELGDNNTSTSDSNKRKGEKETKEDTACSSLKRKKSRGVP